MPASTQLVVSVNGTELTLTTDYTVDTATETITLVSSVNGEDVVKIARSTKNDDRYTTFTDASVLDAETSNLDADQIFFVAQEAFDAANQALTKNAANQWDGQCLPSNNCAASVGPNSWVTRAEMEAYVIGGDGAELATAHRFGFTGDGSQTELELDGLQGLSTERVLVYVDGVLQHADGTVYTVENNDDVGYPAGGDGDDYVVFAAAPPVGVAVEARVLDGIVVTSIGDDAIEGDNIREDAIGIDHLDFAAGDDDRVILIDALGDPTLSQLNAAQIQDFDTQVQTSRLDQMAAPTAAVDVNNQYLQNVRTPAEDSDAATKGYVDAVEDAFPVSNMAHGAVNLASVGVFKPVTLGFRPRFVHVQMTMEETDGSNQRMFTIAKGHDDAPGASVDLDWQGTAWVNLAINITSDGFEFRYIPLDGGAQRSESQFAYFAIG